MIVNHPNRYGTIAVQPCVISCAEHRAQRKMFNQIRLVRTMPQVNYPNVAVMREQTKLRQYKLAVGLKL